MLSVRSKYSVDFPGNFCLKMITAETETNWSKQCWNYDVLKAKSTRISQSKTNGNLSLRISIAVSKWENHIRWQCFWHIFCLFHPINYYLAIFSIPKKVLLHMSVYNMYTVDCDFRIILVSEQLLFKVSVAVHQSKQPEYIWICQSPWFSFSWIRLLLHNSTRVVKIKQLFTGAIGIIL